MAAKKDVKQLPEGRSTVVDVPAELVKRYDFNASPQIEQEAIQPFTSSLESFAGKLTVAGGAYLGASFDVVLESSEQVTGSTVLEKMPSSAYMISLQVLPQSGTAVLEIEHSLLFPVVDVLLGGSGSGDSPVTRSVTEIEKNIAGEFVRLICRELQSAWRSCGAEEIVPGNHCVPDQLVGLLPAGERVLLCNFSVKMPAAAGSFCVVLPTSSVTTFLRTLLKELPCQAPTPKRDLGQEHTERLLGCSFGAELGIAGARVQVADLVHAEVGGIIKLRVPVRTPACLSIGGRGAFEAHPVRSGGHRAAQLGNRLPLSSYLPGEMQ